MATLQSESKAQSGTRTARLSPEINEVLHMLKALETQTPEAPKEFTEVERRR